MDAKSSRSQPLALEPLDGPTAGGDPVRATGAEFPAGAGPRGLRITTADEFLARAAQEYQEGHIDQALWTRTSAQIGADQELVVAAYLRARATSLQLQKRDERAKERLRMAGSTRVASNPQEELQSHQEDVSTQPVGVGRLIGKPQFKYAVTGVALAAAVAVVWLVASPRDSKLPPQSIVVAAAASQAPPAPPTSLASAQPAVKNPGDPASQGSSDPTLETKVQQLKQAGNWNVLVLYASEWTRKEPLNAAAWTELSIGYIKMRQLGDSLEAAKRAVELSPEEPRHWRNLGHVNLALERLSEARIAFDKALALNSEDADALCGAALVAKRQAPAKQVDVIAVRLKSNDGTCDGASDAAASPVVAGASAARSTVQAGRR
jgi:tetratricopeptide (TPR) repeat protein